MFELEGILEIIESKFLFDIEYAVQNTIIASLTDGHPAPSQEEVTTF